MHTQKIKNNVIVDESMMKAYLLDYWRSSGYISSSTLVINELTFVGLSRRIDLALVKDGELIGIEIKSDDLVEAARKKILGSFRVKVPLKSKYKPKITS